MDSESSDPIISGLGLGNFQFARSMLFFSRNKNIIIQYFTNFSASHHHHHHGRQPKISGKIAISMHFLGKRKFLIFFSRENSKFFLPKFRLNFRSS